ncbi:MAG: response regulator transcription factor [Deltaproteobacteria bacterium]|nr:MAG: response regulator transcription factor [Deltaproteobacteria bacterium]
MSVDKPTKVFLADDHPLFRLGLRHSLDQEKSIVVIGEASDGFRAVEQMQAEPPDVSLIDVDMPGLSGIGAIRVLRKSSPQMKMIVLSTYNDKNYVREAMQAGADGYVLKCVGIKELVRIIKTLDAGKPAVSPYLANLSLNCETPKEIGPKRQGPSLTYREKEILQAITEGKGNKEIARAFHISIETVKSHLKTIYRKLKVGSRIQALRTAQEKNLLD